MLYATTRNNVDTFTAQRALKLDRTPDGGFFVPMRLPVFSHREICALKDQTTGEIMAGVLNRFFPCSISGRDVEFLLGRSFYRVTEISHRIQVAEIWRNQDLRFDRVVRLLTQRISAEPGISDAGEWMQLALRIALIFALYGAMEADGAHWVDVAVGTGDFTWPMAVCYARQMGLPVGTVVCCCNDNGGVWDLLQRGQVKVDTPALQTNTPEWDIPLPQGLERLIYGTLGRAEVERFCQICEKGGFYELDEETHALLRDGMYASVISGKRLSGVISNVYKTNGLILCPYSAVIYSGLLDYRSRTGESRPALMICEKSPMDSALTIESILGMDETMLRRQLNLG